MPALVAGIHVFVAYERHEDVGGRDKACHDEVQLSADHQGH
jgi:hypothetical protein